MNYFQGWRALPFCFADYQIGDILLEIHDHPCFKITSAMADREDNVYKAKLAEQAERYDGKFNDIPIFLRC